MVSNHKYDQIEWVPFPDEWHLKLYCKSKKLGKIRIGREFQTLQSVHLSVSIRIKPGQKVGKRMYKKKKVKEAFQNDHFLKIFLHFVDLFDITARKEKTNKMK